VEEKQAEIEKFEKIDHFAQKTIDLQTAEIKKLEAEIERLKVESECADGYAEALAERVRAEAIKEFAERLKEKRAGWGYPMFVLEIDAIDNLVKEMAGE
jgi:FtsZ-binding cell division protein ZapB